MKRFAVLGIVALVLVAASLVTFKYYSYIFAKNLEGQIQRVERVNQQEMVIANGANIPPSQLYSFAISIKDASGEIHTASSEDRQWAVVQPGQCVKAKFLPYPPWNLEKSGTFYGARLLQLSECKK